MSDSEDDQDYMVPWKLQKLVTMAMQVVFAVAIIVLFVYQTWMINDIIHLIGNGKFVLTDGQFAALCGTMFAEIAAIVLVVGKYLFSEKQILEWKTEQQIHGVETEGKISKLETGGKINKLETELLISKLTTALQDLASEVNKRELSTTRGGDASDPGKQDSRSRIEELLNDWKNKLPNSESNLEEQIRELKNDQKNLDLKTERKINELKRKLL